MPRILFVCHGNICRSPMAEFILKKMAEDAGRAGEFVIASAATSREEIGNDIYPPAQACLRAHGVPFSARAARQVAAADYDAFDLIIVMDAMNLRNLRRLIPADPEGKIRKLLPGRDVADPWYTGDFERTFADLAAGCKQLLSADIFNAGTADPHA